MNHYVVMSGMMILSGLLSTMNVWADKVSDIRLSLNDLYMVSLMTGWMVLFMGLYYKDTLPGIIGASIVAVSLYLIRTQAFISQEQFILGMIPHHSMAVHMSKQLMKKPHTIHKLVTSIIKSQEEEIAYMKGV